MSSDLQREPIDEAKFHPAFPSIRFRAFLTGDSAWSGSVLRSEFAVEMRMGFTQVSLTTQTHRNPN
jgi:hypothetical protein